MSKEDTNIVMPDFEKWAKNLLSYYKHLGSTPTEKVLNIKQELEDIFEQGRALGRRENNE